MAKLSAVEKGRLNDENYSRYIQSLEDQGLGFPVNQFGDVNVTKIAEEVGCLRQVFKKGTKLGLRLEKDLKRIGLENAKPKSDSFIDAKLKDVQKEVSLLRKQNALLIETIESMKQESMQTESDIRKLKAKLVEQEESFDQVIRTGRRFTLD